MGAWGVNFTECDGSLDFLGDVGEARDWTLVSQRLTDYVADGGYDDGEEALAAAELVAAALGHPSPLLEPELAVWAASQAQHGAACRDLAIQALELVMNDSELNELWAETEDDYAKWQALIIELNNRLVQASPV